ncbi:hypothetical protein DDP54_10835 [Cellulomonas sp. WB94]|uniref:CAP domain-containing protein n=1 Tax=Cellulomonas sp. WB94 TaxID=2173174 RepID=UPI000D57EDC8|nr:CAP domain-containing protein [Cellulomonas sp. WB94]PVU83410.1 hypothetical protein DDP54_10835 [Cellulomonas sp. WB94]
MPTTDELSPLRRRDLRAYRMGTLRRRSRRHVVVVASVLGIALLAAVTPAVLSGDTPVEAVEALPARLAGPGDLAARGADQAVRGADGAIGAMVASRSGERRDAVPPVPSPSAMASADVGQPPAVAAPPARSQATSIAQGTIAPAVDATAPAPSTTSTTTPSPTAAPTAAPALSDDEQLAARLVVLTNAERAKAGLVALETSPCATAQAAARAAVLVAQGRFEHDPLGPVVEACGGSSVGENLALGYSTPEAMTAGWMASPGHRENILRAYTSIGIGCVTGSAGALCSQLFLG